MQVTVEIGGRAALPLRAIPYVTSWKVSPDELVDVLFERSHARPSRFNNLCAYLMGAQGRFVQVPPEQWSIQRAGLESISARLKAGRGGGTGAAVESYSFWQIESILELPDNAFAWLDEFQKWYAISRPMLLDPLDDASTIRYEEPTLCLTPILPPEIEKRLWRYPPQEGGVTPNIRWTSELLEEMKAYRDKNGTKATAQKYEVSEARIRELAPSEEAPIKPLANYAQLLRS